MATDFSKLMYHVVEEHLKNQVGDEQFRGMDKTARRKVMDEMMTHFARCLMAMVVEFSVERVKAAEAAKAKSEAAIPAEQPSVPPMAPSEAYGGSAPEGSGDCKDCECGASRCGEQP